MRQATFATTTLVLGQVHQSIRVQLAGDSRQRTMPRKRAFGAPVSIPKGFDSPERDDLGRANPPRMEADAGLRAVHVPAQHGQRVDQLGCERALQGRGLHTASFGDLTAATVGRRHRFERLVVSPLVERTALAKPSEHGIEMTRHVCGDHPVRAHEETMRDAIVVDADLTLEVAQRREQAIQAVLQREHPFDIARSPRAPKFLRDGGELAPAPALT